MAYYQLHFNIDPLPGFPVGTKTMVSVVWAERATNKTVARARAAPSVDAHSFSNRLRRRTPDEHVTHAENFAAGCGSRHRKYQEMDIGATQ
jgi:hypothetical protein